MSDINRVRETIRKLMNHANCESATTGEIENAMSLAASLIDKHHLNPAEFNQAPKAQPGCGRFAGQTESPKFHKWESTLAFAVSRLFGCVKHYLSTDKEPFRVNGVVQFYTGKYAGQMKECRVVFFYGPWQEAQEAAELYTEWCHLIAYMGVQRWGGAYRGDGEMYCEGFADQVLVQVAEIDSKRQFVQAAPLKALPGQTTSITLRDRYKHLQAEAISWLQQEQGITLHSRRGASGSGSGSANAYGEGRLAGKTAGFGKSSGRKQLPGH